MNIDDVELALEVIKERLSKLENGDIKVVETCDPTINERYIASQKLLDSCNKLYNEMSDLLASLNYRISTINDSQKDRVEAFNPKLRCCPLTPMTQKEMQQQVALVSKYLEENEPITESEE